MKQLAGKVAIVTGASSGIGYHVARLLARHGARLVVTGPRQRDLNALVQDIGRDDGVAIAVAGDIRDEALMRRLVQVAEERFGGLDIIFFALDGAASPLIGAGCDSPPVWRDSSESPGVVGCVA
jgi:NAD(P)-dependent dehydrogenase (short-subunit alcohol dehydrogenase family)